jgi:hypothetical protein
MAVIPSSKPLSIFSTISPRTAILGGVGMGKTSLARAVLHHPTIMEKHQQRFFVAAESATNSVELASQVGLAVGLKPGKDIAKAVIRYFSEQSSCLLIVDDLETPWEPIESRGGIAEFLSLLTDVPHLALIVSEQPSSSGAHGNMVTDHNAWRGEAWQNKMDSSVFATFATSV